MLLGEGKWKFLVDTMFYKGEALLAVGEKDGGYDIQIELTGMDMPENTFEDIEVDEETNTVTGIAHTSLLPGKDIPFGLTVEGDTASGFLKIPFMGKIRLRDGVRIG
ncbi:MAG: hypothetical protein LBG83_02845 [Oscillospiraceae bacterium]|jgi:hypothetical protein|nr:hypothetical protein [Oscillospiraceae bacterium]